MRKLKLAIVLPLAQCLLEVILLHFGSVQVPIRVSGDYYPQIGTPAIVGFLLNLPATCTAVLLARILPRLFATGAGFRAAFFSGVVLTWYLIGLRLDKRRVSRRQPSNRKSSEIVP